MRYPALYDALKDITIEAFELFKAKIDVGVDSKPIQCMVNRGRLTYYQMDIHGNITIWMCMEY